MGIYADDVREFVGEEDKESEPMRPLGERLRGLAGGLSVDSVEEVRDIREHR